MDSHPSSESVSVPQSLTFQFVTATGEPVDRPPAEWEEGLIQLPLSAATWAQARLIRNGSEMPIALRRMRGVDVAIATWPRSNCGSYRLELVMPDSRQYINMLLPPSKISTDAVHAMIVDLRCALPISLSIGLSMDHGLVGASQDAAADTSLAQELALLRRLVRGRADEPGLCRALSSMATDPYRMLTLDTVWINSARARRPRPDRLFVAMIRPDNQAQPVPNEVLDGRVDPTFDVYENRLVVSVLRRINERLSRLVAVLPRLSGSWVEASALKRQLRMSMSDAAFLVGVPALAGRVHSITMVLQRRPAYRAFLQAAIELNTRLIADADLAGLDAPIEGLPALYEAWGCLSVLDILIAAAREQGFHLVRQRLVERDSRGWFTSLARGNVPVLELEDARMRRIRAWYQLRVDRATRPAAVSYSQVPDLFIRFDGPCGGSGLVLDPKYKLDSDGLPPGQDDELPGGAPKKVDLDKMHAYRDSIRDEGQSVVSFAGILYPGPTYMFPRGVGPEEASLGAIRAVPGTASDTRATLTTLFEARLGSAI